MPCEHTEITLDAGDVDPASRWAGQLMAARAAEDAGTYQALIEAAPEDDLGWYVGAVLTAAALGLRALAGERS